MTWTVAFFVISNMLWLTVVLLIILEYDTKEGK